MNPEQFEITQSRDRGEIAVCAMMMTKTEPWITLGFDYALCLKAFEGECKEIYVARTGREIAGFVILQVCGTFSGYIQTICIREDLRGRGYGTRLLGFCEERILRFSPNIFICVSSFNEGAYKLYTSFGFKLVGELNDFVRTGFTELLLRKTAGPRTGYMGTETGKKQ